VSEIGHSPSRLLSVLENISDPFCVADREWRFVFANRAFGQAVGRSRDELIGKSAWEEFSEAVDSELHRKLVRAMEEKEAVCFEAQSYLPGVWTAVRAYPVPEGLAVLFWDATESRRVEVEREQLREQEKRISRALQQALLPPALAQVPNVDLGARYLAAGEGIEVGGDFYDVFAIVNDGWAVAVGDVTGKGPEAAALTSLARYTLRTAAMREKSPGRVLSVLNEEILRQTDGERLFSVVYGEMERHPGEPGRIELRLARGGHPSPLILRSSGKVEGAAPPGTILGAVQEPEIHQWSTFLGRGESAIFYTDGVLEARDPQGEFFGEERLARLLEECRGLTADEIAGRIEHEVMDFQKGHARDDVAILVIRVQQ
jgi:sigma-B regulation protein RsbU (phosphoserine phosphatase)